MLTYLGGFLDQNLHRTHRPAEIRFHRQHLARPGLGLITKASQNRRWRTADRTALVRPKLAAGEINQTHGTTRDSQELQSTRERIPT